MHDVTRHWDNANLNPGGAAPARMASTRQDHVLRVRVWAPDRPARWGHPRPENKPRVHQLVTARLGWLSVPWPWERPGTGPHIVWFPSWHLAEERLGRLNPDRVCRGWVASSLQWM